MKHMVRIAALATLSAAAILANGCSSARVDYFGDDLGESEAVDTYYDKSEVKRKFRVVGRALGTAPMGSSTESVFEKFLSKAKTKGVDGVIFYGFDREVAGSTTVGGGATRPGSIIIGGGASKNTTQKEWTIKADYIKYTDTP